MVSPPCMTSATASVPTRLTGTTSPARREVRRSTPTHRDAVRQPRHGGPERPHVSPHFPAAVRVACRLDLATDLLGRRRSLLEKRDINRGIGGEHPPRLGELFDVPGDDPHDFSLPRANHWAPASQLVPAG